MTTLSRIVLSQALCTALALSAHAAEDVVCKTPVGSLRIMSEGALLTDQSSIQYYEPTMQAGASLQLSSPGFYVWVGEIESLQKQIQLAEIDFQFDDSDKQKAQSPELVGLKKRLEELTERLAKACTATPGCKYDYPDKNPYSPGYVTVFDPRISPRLIQITLTQKKEGGLFGPKKVRLEGEFTTEVHPGSNIPVPGSVSIVACEQTTAELDAASAAYLSKAEALYAGEKRGSHHVETIAELEQLLNASVELGK